MAKITKKQEKDVLFDISEVKESTQHFFEKYQNYVIGVIAGILLLVGLFFVYKYLYQEPREKEALQELYKAQLQFEKDSFALALDNPGEGYKGFIDIADDYKRTKAGNLANYYAGICYLNLGKFEASAAYLEDFKPAGSVTPILKYGTLGDVYSEMEDMDKAKKAYEKAVSKDENEYLTPYYLRKLGLLYRATNDKEKSIEVFERIIADFPNSNFAGEVEKYIPVE